MVSLLCLLRQGSGQSHVREGPETHLGVAANQEGAPDVLLLMAWGLACLLVRAASTAASSSSDTATRPHGHTPLSLPSSLLTGPSFLAPTPGSIDLSRSTSRACLVSLTHTSPRPPRLFAPLPLPSPAPTRLHILASPVLVPPVSSSTSSNLDGNPTHTS